MLTLYPLHALYSTPNGLSIKSGRNPNRNDEAIPAGSRGTFNLAEHSGITGGHEG